ncbi:MAG: RcpC/CpaB family pilus assembly protein [Anaerolineae bacterium]
MRPRTLVLLVLVLLAGAATAVLVVNRNANENAQDEVQSGVSDTTTTETAEESSGISLPLFSEQEEETDLSAPAAQATPAFRMQPVVIATANLPVGERIRPDLITIEMRPDTNIALQGGYTFSDVEEVLDRIVKVEVSQGQAILRPMVALNPSDLASFGSDLALYIDRGKVAVAFPINRFSGAAFALRPGDRVDVLMTLQVVEVDPEFQTALPNTTNRVINSELLAGRSFLFEETAQGRLEFIPEINQVAEIVPNDPSSQGENFAVGKPIPKRVTQLTIQQAEVLWVGTWRDPQELAQNAAAEAAAAAAEGAAAETAQSVAPPPFPARFELKPDVVILSMTSQDALALKWALERGIDIDLALRAQGDTTAFVTTSVSLPQIVDQGGLVIPELADFDLHPRAEEVEPPSLPVEPLDEPPPN